MANPNNAARAVAHTARMLKVLSGTPDHRRAVEYEKTVAEYRRYWAGLADDQKNEAISEAHRLDDLTDELVDAAVEQLSKES